MAGSTTSYPCSWCLSTGRHVPGSNNSHRLTRERTEDLCHHPWPMTTLKVARLWALIGKKNELPAGACLSVHVLDVAILYVILILDEMVQKTWRTGGWMLWGYSGGHLCLRRGRALHEAWEVNRKHLWKQEEGLTKVLSLRVKVIYI